MPHKNITAKKYRQHKHHYKPAQHGGAYSVLTETPETLVVIDNLYDSLYIFDKSSGVEYTTYRKEGSYPITSTNLSLRPLLNKHGFSLPSTYHNQSSPPSSPTHHHHQQQHQHSLPIHSPPRFKAPLSPDTPEHMKQMQRLTLESPRSRRASRRKSRTRKQLHFENPNSPHNN